MSNSLQNLKDCYDLLRDTKRLHTLKVMPDDQAYLSYLLLAHNFLACDQEVECLDTLALIPTSYWYLGFVDHVIKCGHDRYSKVILGIETETSLHELSDAVLYLIDNLRKYGHDEKATYIEDHYENAKAAFVRECSS